MAITVNGAGGTSARAAAEAVSGVQSVEERPPAEPGEGVVTLQVDAASDVRAELVRALIGAGLGVLQVGPGERELESMFLELATPAKGEADGAAKKAAPRRTKRKVAEKTDNEEGES